MHSVLYNRHTLPNASVASYKGCLSVGGGENYLDPPTCRRQPPPPYPQRQPPPEATPLLAHRGNPPPLPTEAAYGVSWT